MKPINLSTGVVALALAATLSITGNAGHAEGPVLKSSNTSQFDHWYGRAGGTTGSERIEALNQATLPPPHVGVTYDEDIAQRTNMQREGFGSKEVGISYDEGIAARTNMGRSQQEPTPEVAKAQK